MIDALFFVTFIINLHIFMCYDTLKRFPSLLFEIVSKCNGIYMIFNRSMNFCIHV